MTARSAPLRLSLAAVLPAACIVHCFGAPLLVAALPGLPLGEGVETALLAAASVLAVLTAARGVRLHGRRAVWLPIAAGLVVLAARAAGLLEVLPEQASAVAGSLLLGVGMLWNARLAHRADACSCPCPAHEDGLAAG